MIASLYGAKIGAHEWVEVGGVVFDMKHHVGSSSVPHSRSSAISREALWSQLWSDAGHTPKADVLIRSHVHYHAGSFDYSIKPHWRLTTPALQAMGTKFGSRRCSGLVDFGFLVFDCNRGNFTMTPVLAKLDSQIAKVTKI